MGGGGDTVAGNSTVDNNLSIDCREAVINTLVHAHKAVKKLNEQENKRGRR